MKQWNWIPKQTCSFYNPTIYSMHFRKDFPLFWALTLHAYVTTKLRQSFSFVKEV